jgi:protein TonB
LRAGQGDVAAPRKTKDQRPQYPTAALKARREGMVIAESVISSRGCVRELRVVKSAGLDLDVAGLLAVSQWEFEPARQDGRPIAVRMTVTVNFTIQP